MEEGYKNASFLSKVVFVFLIIAFLLHMIGFYTTNWSILEYVDIFRLPETLHVTEYTGLWKHCVATPYMVKCTNFKSDGSKYNT